MPWSAVFYGLGQVAELLAVGDFHLGDHRLGAASPERLADHVVDGLVPGPGPLFWTVSPFPCRRAFQVFQEIEERFGFLAEMAEELAEELERFLLMEEGRLLRPRPRSGGRRRRSMLR